MCPVCWRHFVGTSGTDMAFYLDTSALVKLVVAEPETDVLREWLVEADRQPVAGDLVRTELMRAVRRAAPDRLVRVREVLDGLILLELETSVFVEAGRLEPAELRSLDALHVASALSLGDDLQGIVTYDERLATAAEANGVPALAPA
ncbi:MAG: type II toxin-antitoxin system VapC family toxin [Actinomycetota bacterium]